MIKSFWIRLRFMYMEATVVQDLVHTTEKIIRLPYLMEVAVVKEAMSTSQVQAASHLFTI